MVEQPRADWRFCLGLLTERRPIVGVTGSKESTVELSAYPIEELRNGRGNILATNFTFSTVGAWTGAACIDRGNIPNSPSANLRVTFGPISMPASDTR